MVEKKNQHGTLGREEMWVFEGTRCSDESKNKQTTRERERENVIGGVTRGTMQGQKIYDNNSIRTGCTAEEGVFSIRCVVGRGSDLVELEFPDASCVLRG